MTMPRCWMADCRNGSAKAAPTESRRAAAAATRRHSVPTTARRRLRGIGDVLGNVKTQAELVLDARAAGRFTGEVPEPRAGMRSGHIPGSASLPYTDLLNADGTFRSADAVRARLAQAGVDGSRPGGDKLRLGRDGLHPDAGPAHRRTARGRRLRRVVDRMGRPLRHAGGDEASMTDTTEARLPHAAVAYRPCRQARAWLRQSAAAARLHRAVSDGGGAARDGRRGAASAC